jgi:hypothetical protein
MSNKSNKIKITVTKDDIKSGHRGSVYCCPIAISVRRQAFSSKNVSVSAGDCSIAGTYWELSRSAQRFISAFDNGRPVKPFSFIMTQED